MVYCKQCKGIYVEGSAQVAASNQTGILTKEYKTSTTLNLKKHTKLPFTILAAKYEIDKKNVLKEYVSQIEKYKNRNQDLLSYIDAKDKINGIKSHVDYAEGFIINKMVQ